MHDSEHMDLVWPSLFPFLMPVLSTRIRKELSPPQIILLI